MNVNKVVIMGRLTYDPEVRQRRRKKGTNILPTLRRLMTRIFRFRRDI